MSVSTKVQIGYITMAMLSCLLFMLNSNIFAAEPKKGSISGGVVHAMPAWFKESFLDISEDISDASDSGKHVMLFLHLNGCPYCAKMLDDSFRPDDKKAFIQESFDVIAINVKGDREVAFTEDLSMIEKDLAKKLKVRYTPTILFMDGDNKQVLRINGYRSTAQFIQALNYVKSKSYEKQSLADYVEQNKNKPVYEFKDNALFSQHQDLSKITTPLAVIFEDKSCVLCDAFHQKRLAHADVKNELKAYTVVRLDADDESSIVTPGGKKLSPKQWAKELKLSYRPGIVLFDKNKERTRIDGFLYPFHFKEVLRYVSKQYYEQYDNWLGYLNVRQDELIEQGMNINLSKE